MVSLDLDLIPPVASSQTFQTTTNTPLYLTLIGSDPNGYAVTYAIINSPTNGTLSGTPPNLYYSPAPDYEGPDGFTFKVNDGVHDSQPATITISVDSVIQFSIASAPEYVRSNSVPTQL